MPGKSSRNSTRKGALTLRDWINVIQNEMNLRIYFSRNHILVAAALATLTSLLVSFVIIDELKIKWIYFLTITTILSIAVLAIITRFLWNPKGLEFRTIVFAGIATIPCGLGVLYTLYLFGPVVWADIWQTGIFTVGGMLISFFLALAIGSVIYLYHVVAVLQTLLLKILSGKTFSHEQISAWHEEILGYSPWELYEVSIGKKPLPWDKPKR